MFTAQLKQFRRFLERATAPSLLPDSSLKLFPKVTPQESVGPVFSVGEILAVGVRKEV